MRVSAIVAVGLWLGLASAAHADNWALIDTVETPGQRSVFFAKYDVIKSYIDPTLSGPDLSRELTDKDLRDPPRDPFAGSRVIEVEVVEVFEAADRPRVSNYRVVADCGRGRLRIAEVDSLFRDGSTSMGGAGTEWFEAPVSGWLSRVRVIACERSKVEAAIQRSARARSSDAVMDLGLLHVGEYALTYPLIELTWSVFWPDAVEPPVRTLSAAEHRELQRTIDARMASLQAQVAAYVAIAGGSLESQTEERAFMAEVRAVFASKPRGQRVVFGGMAGSTMDEVVSFWGQPDKVRTIGDAQALEYESTVDTRALTVQVWAGAGEMVTELGELQHCAVTLLMRAGGSRPGPRLADVHVGGTNCRRSTLDGIR